MSDPGQQQKLKSFWRWGFEIPPWSKLLPKVNKRRCLFSSRLFPYRIREMMQRLPNQDECTKPLVLFNEKYQRQALQLKGKNCEWQALHRLAKDGQCFHMDVLPTCLISDSLSFLHFRLIFNMYIWMCMCVHVHTRARVCACTPYWQVPKEARRRQWNPRV